MADAGKAGGAQASRWRRWLGRPEIGAVAALLVLAMAMGMVTLAGPEASEAAGGRGDGASEPVMQTGAESVAANTQTSGATTGNAAGAASGEAAMSIPQVVVLSVIEGVTEFLPISSTGHIILAQRAMGIEQGQAADAFAICIQAGAILAVLGLYYQRTRQISQGLLGRDEQGLRLGVNIAVAFVPFMIVALLLYEPIMELFTLRPSVVMWFVGGVVILWVAWWLRGRSPHEGLSVEDLTWRAALVIGLIQCFAVVPGTSRALAAILGGLVVGMSLTAAVEFSFLLGVLTLLAAAIYEGWGSGWAVFEVYGWVVPLVGLVAAALSAAAAVKWMVSYLDRYSMAVFGWYRIALALGVAALLAAELIAE